MTEKPVIIDLSRFANQKPLAVFVSMNNSGISLMNESNCSDAFATGEHQFAPSAGAVRWNKVSIERIQYTSRLAQPLVIRFMLMLDHRRQRVDLREQPPGHLAPAHPMNKGQERRQPRLDDQYLPVCLKYAVYFAQASIEVFW
jgi:hypothetical protein